MNFVLSISQCEFIIYVTCTWLTSKAVQLFVCLFTLIMKCGPVCWLPHKTINEMWFNIVSLSRIFEMAARPNPPNYIFLLHRTILHVSRPNCRRYVTCHPKKPVRISAAELFGARSTNRLYHRLLDWMLQHKLLNYPGLEPGNKYETFCWTKKATGLLK